MDEVSTKEVYETLGALIKEEDEGGSEIISLVSSLDTKLFDGASQEILFKITERARLLKKSAAQKSKLSDILYGKAITDALTGLKNKRFFYDIIPMLETIKDLSYLMVDIDHFKLYNDRFGHPQGDMAIIAVANTIEQVSGSNITIRFGGEEFSVILVGYEDPEKKVYAHAEDIRQGVERRLITPFSDKEMANHIFRKEFACKDTDLRDSIISSIVNFFNDKEINCLNYLIKRGEYFDKFSSSLSEPIKSYLNQLQRITVSIGGAIRAANEPLDIMINRADQALYEAKLTRNTVVIAK